jgi:hypothetical protein
MVYLSDEDKKFIEDYRAERALYPHKYFPDKFHSTCAKISCSVYSDDDNKIVENFICRRKYDRNTPFFNLFHLHVYDEIDGNRSVLAFRGTSTKTEWIRNIEGEITNFLWKIDLHRAVIKTIKFIKESPDREYYVTGHSAGGFVAQFIAREFMMSGASYCSPSLPPSNFLTRDVTHMINRNYQLFYNHAIPTEIVYSNFGRNYFGIIILHRPWTNNIIELHFIDKFIENHFSNI